MDFLTIFLRKSVVYDGKVILIIEGLENFLDPETGFESSIKFWLPKSFPKHIRVITTAAKGSKSYNYLKRLGCKIIEMRAEPKMMQFKLDNLESRKFLCGQAQKDKVFDIIKRRINNEEISALFMKIAISCFCPYPSEGIVSEEDVDEDDVRDILATVDDSV